MDWHFNLFSGNQSQWHLELISTEKNDSSKTGMSLGKMIKIYHKLLRLNMFAGCTGERPKKLGKWNTNKVENLGSFIAYAQ